MEAILIDRQVNDRANLGQEEAYTRLVEILREARVGP
jgi:hypothetical protein